MTLIKTYLLSSEIFLMKREVFGGLKYRAMSH